MCRRIASLIPALAFCGVCSGVDDIFLGGKDFLLSSERTEEGREIQNLLPFGSTERDWEEKIEIHHYPDLRSPRRVVLFFLERLRERYPETIYRVLPDPREDRAGVSFLVAVPGEVRLEYLLYAETEGGPGLMAYRFVLRSEGPDARYSRSLLRGKWDYYERAFLEVDWPKSMDSQVVPDDPMLFGMGGLQGSQRVASDESLEERSLTVRSLDGRVLRVD